MGGRRYRTDFEGRNIFFVTTSTSNREERFSTKIELTKVNEIMFDVVKLQNCRLFGYVILPNHVHFLIGTIEGGNQLSRFMHSFKGNVRKAIVGNVNLWQQRFDDLVIRTTKQFRLKLKYIHMNPVKRELVNRPEDWSYSSYRFWTFGEENPFLTRDIQSFFSG